MGPATVNSLWGVWKRGFKLGAVSPRPELGEALTTLKLYVQQQWDPGMLSLAFDVVDDSHRSPARSP